jgi:hypothetical protein
MGHGKKYSGAAVLFSAWRLLRRRGNRSGYVSGGFLFLYLNKIKGNLINCHKEAGNLQKTYLKLN